MPQITSHQDISAEEMSWLVALCARLTCKGHEPVADFSAVCLKRKASAVVDAPALHLALKTCLDKSTNLGLAVHGPMKSARMLSIEGGKFAQLVSYLKFMCACRRV